MCDKEAREDLVFQAKYAENAERYDDMADAMRQVAEMDQVLEVEVSVEMWYFYTFLFQFWLVLGTKFAVCSIQKCCRSQKIILAGHNLNRTKEYERC